MEFKMAEKLKDFNLTTFKSCEDCEALWYCATVPCGCMLRHLNKLENGKYIPLEPCEKPLDDKDYKSIYAKLDRTKTLRWHGKDYNA